MAAFSNATFILTSIILIPKDSVLSTMEQQEKYTLSWHSYSDHLREALREMMKTTEFADVTLVTDDKQQIRAHRNILSACSPVFKNILKIDSSNTNPFIYLRGIQQSEMESIMQFIYLGEAKFDEERMNEFLKVSKNLEIKDLSTVTELNDQIDSNEESSEHEDNVAEVEDVDEVPAQTLNEDVEYQTQTPNQSSEIKHQQQRSCLRRQKILNAKIVIECLIVKQVYFSTLNLNMKV